MPLVVEPESRGEFEVDGGFLNGFEGDGEGCAVTCARSGPSSTMARKIQKQTQRIRRKLILSMLRDGSVLIREAKVHHNLGVYFDRFTL